MWAWAWMRSSTSDRMRCLPAAQHLLAFDPGWIGQSSLCLWRSRVGVGLHMETLSLLPLCELSFPLRTASDVQRSWISRWYVDCLECNFLKPNGGRPTPSCCSRVACGGLPVATESNDK